MHEYEYLGTYRVGKQARWKIRGRVVHSTASHKPPCPFHRPQANTCSNDTCRCTERKGTTVAHMPREKGDHCHTHAPRERGPLSHTCPERKGTTLTHAPRERGPLSHTCPERKGTTVAHMHREKGDHCRTHAPRERGPLSHRCTERKGTTVTQMHREKGDHCHRCTERKGTTVTQMHREKGDHCRRHCHHPFTHCLGLRHTRQPQTSTEHARGSNAGREDRLSLLFTRCSRRLDRAAPTPLHPLLAQARQSGSHSSSPAARAG